jgi:hypothetical protein
MRDHNPIKIEDFGGFFDRGDLDTVPLNHSTELINFKFNKSDIETRDGLETRMSGFGVLRMYYFPDAAIQENISLLVLKDDHKIYHIYGDNWDHSFEVSNAITAMTDFVFTEYYGRAYISPTVKNNAGGVSNEFTYVYDGKALAKMRKIAGTPITGALTVTNSGTAGNVDEGIHVFGIVAESDTGFQSEIGPATLPTVTAPGAKKIDITAASGPTTTVKRHIVASKAIKADLYTGNPKDYELFFVPDGVINNNTNGATITVDFADGSLVESAAHLIDLFSELPSCGGFGWYHGRLLLWGVGDGTVDGNQTFVNEVLVSLPDEPEAFDAVNGLLLIPRDGIGVTYCQEYRDILYVANFNRTYTFNDNGDDPTSWPSTKLDEGIGIAKKGVSSVWITGGINTEALVVFSDGGIYIFNGLFNQPELSYKIRDYWIVLNKNDLRNGRIHAYTDSTNKLIYFCIPDLSTILVCDYSEGLTFENVRWSKWTFDATPETITLIDKDYTLYIGFSTGIGYIKVGKLNDTIPGSSATAIPNPTITSSMMNNPEPEDENIYHFGGTRIRAAGSGNLRPTLFGLDDSPTQTLAVMSLTSLPTREPFFLANLVSQRARIRLQTTAINEHVRISRVIMYTKFMYTMFPA